MSVRNVVAFVPARGGSKGVPRKNLAPVRGKPLMLHTLDAIRAVSSVNLTIVSTDDPEIAAVAKAVGAHIHHRPQELATDESRVVDALLDAAKSMSLDPQSVVIVLQPTSPLRRASDIRAALELHQKSGGAPVVSVVEWEHHPLKALRIEADVVVAQFGAGYLEASRQNLPRLFRPNGAVYLSLLATIQETRTLVPEGSVPFIMSRESSVDIDDRLDIALANFLIARDQL